MLEVLPAEGGAGGRCRRSVAGADEIAAVGTEVVMGDGDRGVRS
jgi:hypothetical protein